MSTFLLQVQLKDLKVTESDYLNNRVIIFTSGDDESENLGNQLKERMNSLGLRPTLDVTQGLEYGEEFFKIYRLGDNSDDNVCIVVTKPKHNTIKE